MKIGNCTVTRGQFRKFVEDEGYKTEAETDGKGGYGWDVDKNDYKQDPKYTWRNPGFEQTDDHPVVELSSGPPVSTYQEYLASACPYDSGDFLVQPVNLLQPRFVVDMIRADPQLEERNREIQKLLLSHFGRKRDGLIYERYVERRHRPDEADLDFCREHRFFAMPIPRDLGGQSPG